MATRLGKTTALGVCVGLLGAACALIPFTSSVEEKFGLDWLFNLRGPRQPPAEVVVVAIDKQSADRLGLPNDPIKWPRSLYATLVDRLSGGGASVIAFDIYFREPRNLEHDQQFAEAVRKAGNVVLIEYLEKEIIPVPVDSGEPAASLTRETRLPPIKALQDAALAVAPFPLPKVPVTVSQFWLFKTDSGNIPTLPVIALQAHARDHLEEFLQLVRQEAGANRLVPELQESASRKDIPLAQLVKLLRSQFNVFPETAPAVLRSIRKDRDPASIPNHLLESLARIYTGPDSHYLNYYGPPRSITTIPFYRIIEPEHRDSRGNNPAFKGKAVFVGFSELLQPEQRDGYYSVYSEASGVDISGVEIAATAFANLLGNQPVRPLPFVWDIPLLFVWGLLLGFLLFYLRVPIALAASGFMTAGYLGIAYYLFQQSATWIPVFIPLVIQMPVAIAIAIIWRNQEVNRDHARTREAFGRFVPGHVVEKVSADLSLISEAGELANGVCLATDAEQYTRLSEQLHPGELKFVLDEYYKAIGSPVGEYGGIISDVVGDALLAIWAAPESDVELRKRASEAALQISVAAEKFHSTINNINLPTRIGLHAGEMFLGNVGAGKHFEYRAIGDIVNTANRIQGLNKLLGTRLLASAETLQGTAGLVNRELGSFMLAGKSRTVTIHELIGTSDVISPVIERLCCLFGQALNDYRRRDWVGAAEKFSRLIEEYDDGPAKFYLQQCQALIHQPPLEAWDATIRISTK